MYYVCIISNIILNVKYFRIAHIILNQISTLKSPIKWILNEDTDTKDIKTMHILIEIKYKCPNRTLGTLVVMVRFELDRALLSNRYF